MTKVHLLPLAMMLACSSDSEGDGNGAADAGEAGTAATSAMGGSGEATGAGVELGCAAEIEHDTTDGATEPVMDAWGAPCTSDAECVALLGEGANCLDKAVIYELPGGYCSKPCSLPDGATFVADDPTCDPAGGVACVGQKPLFEQCAPMCSDDQQCSRAGFTCRQMPMIAKDEDPEICLMPDCCLETCAEA